MKRMTHIRAADSWAPTFAFCKDIFAAAEQINKWHEDNPTRVPATAQALAHLVTRLEQGSLSHFGVSEQMLQDIHRHIFADAAFKGRWRDLDVHVAGDGSVFIPPTWSRIQELMGSLSHSIIRDSQDLTDWYWDFESIHPYQDGNGRVGGVVVAAYSHAKGWLAGGFWGPEQ